MNERLELQVKIISEFLNIAYNTDSIQSRIESLQPDTIEKIFNDLKALDVLDISLSPKMSQLLVELHNRTV